MIEGPISTDSSTVNNDAKIFSNRFNTLCCAYGMDGEDIAKKTYVDPDEVTLWHTGQMIPNTSVLKSLATVFGTSIDYLLGMPNVSPISLSQKNCKECVGYLNGQCEISECHGCIPQETAIHHLEKDAARILYNIAFIKRDNILSKELSKE